VAVIAAAYPMHRVTEETASIYANALADIPGDELQNAVALTIKTEVWFPTVAAIRRAWAEDRLRLPRTEEALAEASEWVRQGTGLSHQLIMRAAKAVSIDVQCMQEDSAGTWRAQFVKAYTAMREAQILELMAGSHGPTDRR
jgi:hypothetical protein